MTPLRSSYSSVAAGRSKAAAVLGPLSVCLRALQKSNSWAVVEEKVLAFLQLTASCSLSDYMGENKELLSL